MEAESGPCVGFSLGLELVRYMTTGRCHLVGSPCCFPLLRPDRSIHTTSWFSFLGCYGAFPGFPQIVEQLVGHLPSSWGPADHTSLHHFVIVFPRFTVGLGDLKGPFQPK